MNKKSFYYFSELKDINPSIFHHSLDRRYIHNTLGGPLMYQTDMHPPSSICFVDMLTDGTDIVHRYVLCVDMIDAVGLGIAFFATSLA